MTAAWLLTGLAVFGIVIGTQLGQSRLISVHLAAAGGGLLSGIGLFWLMPEIAENNGVIPAVAVPVSLAVGLWAADRNVLHASHSFRHGMAGPLVAATALHSFLDGWSIRAVEVQPLANTVVLLGLALHKLPEGLALGWIARHSLQSRHRAVVLCSSAELLTVAGAGTEPLAARLPGAFLGGNTAAVILMLVAGSFLFLGFHTVFADFRKGGVLPAFLVAFALTGLLAFFRHAGQ